MIAPETWVGPVPANQPETRPYWEALRAHRMAVQRCLACTSWQHPPVLICPACGSEELAFERVSGKGTVYSYTVVEREFGLHLGTPWIGAYVALAETPVRVATNLVNCDRDAIEIGTPVSVVYQDYADLDLTLAFFAPDDGR